MGKTTLLERLIPELRSRGLRVSLIKHSHKDIEIDRPGKDSHRLREAGCGEVLLMGRTRWALMHEMRDEEEPSLEWLLSRLQACDLVLIEGFKSGDFPKLEVWREEVGKPALGSSWPGIVATATDTPCGVAQGRVVDLADLDAIVRLVLDHARPYVGDANAPWASHPAHQGSFPIGAPFLQPLTLQ